MIGNGTTSIASGQKALASLIDSVSAHDAGRNEAETRFHIIDRILGDCLGWPPDVVHVEQAGPDRTYSDYELGEPRCAIWEAKGQSHVFELPAAVEHRAIRDLPSVMALNDKAAAAIRQVQVYCASRGVEVAVATNGFQLIAFLATRSDGIPPLEGRCLVIDSPDQLVEEFSRVWQTLSPAGVAERRLRRLLNAGEDQALPPKLSSRLSNYPRYRYPSELQTTLRTLGELLLVDAIEAADVEQLFYRECYCESGTLSQHALVSKRMLKARYTAMFDQAVPAPTVTPMESASVKDPMSDELAVETMSGRPIILIGDVGVGKTSFLKHLMYVTASEELKNALYLYMDLGSQGALSGELKTFVLTEIERQLYEGYGIDVYEDGFVRGVYHGDIMRFRRGIYGSLREEDPQRYEEKVRGFLAARLEARDQHLKASTAHLVRGRRKQVVIVLDNADQRDYEVQQAAFIIGQNFAKDWGAAVFLAVRPQTFHRSRQVGSLTAYPHRVFTISPPRVDRVIEKRLLFAVNLAEGNTSSRWLADVELQLPNIAYFLKALIYSLSVNSDLVEFLSNITAGNIRAVVEFVASFIGNANVDAKKIIRIMEHEGRYRIPIHEFWKAALVGEYSYYDSTSSIALNLFDVTRADSREHFLIPMILGFLDSDGEHRTVEGFVHSKDIVDEMQDWSFARDVSEGALRRANNKRLLETPQRVTFDEDEGGLIGRLPEFFRISTVGAYHLRRWIGDFAYLDVMAFDTPILDDGTRDELGKTVESFAIEDRLDRARIFRSYLGRVWRGSDLAPRYFDWSLAMQTGKGSFDRVAKVVGSGGQRGNGKVRG